MRKRSSRSSADGFSLVEFARRLVISLAVVGAALSLASATRRIYDADASRVRVNQSRARGMDCWPPTSGRPANAWATTSRRSRSRTIRRSPTWGTR